MKLYKSYIFLLMLVMSVFLSGCAKSMSYMERAYQFSAKFEVEGCEVKSSTYSCNMLPYSEARAKSFNPPALPSLTINSTLDAAKLIKQLSSKNTGLQSTNQSKAEEKIMACMEPLLASIIKAQEKLQGACEDKVKAFPTGKPDIRYEAHEGEKAAIF